MGGYSEEGERNDGSSWSAQHRAWKFQDLFRKTANCGSKGIKTNNRQTWKLP